MTVVRPTASFFARPAVVILLGAALLMVPPLLNGFPFVFPDSTDYLTIAPQVFRLPFYGLFITFFHWNHFIWAPIIMQCLVVTHLLWLLVSLTSGQPTARHFLPLMLVMTGFTSLPFFTGWIMADIFTPIMFLTYYILCFHHRALSGWLRYYLFLLAGVATVAHVTNLSLGSGLFILLMLLLVIAHASRAQLRRSLILMGAPLLLAISAVLVFNGLIFQAWSLAPAGQSFFMANLIEYGPARDYLDEACPTRHYRICAYRPLPTLANDLMWVDNSVVWRLGGFMAMQPEATVIVHETLRTHPLQVAWMVFDNVVAALQTHAPAIEFHPNFIINPFRDLVRKKFGEADWRALDASAESRGTIPHTAIETIDSIVTPACFLLLVGVIVATFRSRPQAFYLATATLLFILGNVVLCAALSGVYDRYQARVTWLMPMVLGLLFISYVKKRRA